MKKEKSTRCIDHLPSDWDQDSTGEYGDSALYARRVRDHYDHLLEHRAELDGVTLYRKSDEIIADYYYQGWAAEDTLEALEIAHDYAMEMAEKEIVS